LGTKTPARDGTPRQGSEGKLARAVQESLEVKAAFGFEESRPLVLRVFGRVRLGDELRQIPAAHARRARGLLVSQLDRDGSIFSDVVLEDKISDARLLSEVGREAVNRRVGARAKSPDLLDPPPRHAMKPVSPLAAPAGDGSVLPDIVERKEIETSPARALKVKLRDLVRGNRRHLPKSITSVAV
jgi:hypothetical protein